MNKIFVFVSNGELHKPSKTEFGNVEYVPKLLHRPKRVEKVSPLDPGHLVIICDPAQPGNKAGQVRTVEAKTIHGLLHRVVTKLAALTFSEST